MKTVNFYIAVLVLLFSLILKSACLQAQTSQKMFAVVNIVVENNDSIDSVEFIMNRNNFNSDHLKEFDRYIVPIKNQNGHITIPLTTNLNYGRINFYDSIAHHYQSLEYFNSLFIFSSGDTITLHLSTKGFNFSGKSATSYNCTSEVNKITVKSFSAYNELIKEGKYEEAFQQRRFQYDSVYIRQKNVLNQSAGKINPEIYQLLKLDCWARYNQRVVEVYEVIYKMQDKQFFEVAKTLFGRYYGDYKELYQGPPELFLNSYAYADFLLAKEKTYAVIKNSTNEESFYKKLKFHDMFSVIDEHYKSSPLKDKLFTLAFSDINRHREGDFVNYLDKAIDQASSKTYKYLLQNFKDSNNVGAVAFPFALKDRNDKIHQLSDMKGKVVVMDFWFTGCHGCTEMSSALSPIIESYENNPNLVFVSVCIDPSKKMWLNSLKSHVYCNDDEINLIGEAGLKSEIIKHYNFNGYPSLLVISKMGKIVSVTPPDPRISPTDFKKLIDAQF